MWGGHSLWRTETEADRARNALHNIEEGSNNAFRYYGRPDPAAFGEESESTAVASTDNSSPSRAGGTWGERDGGPVSQADAMADYEALRQQLTVLSKTKSRTSDTASLARTKSNARAPVTRRSTRASTAATEGDVEAQEDQDDDFELDQFMREGHFEKREDGRSMKRVGVVFKNLTVKGVGATSTFVKTLPDAVLGTFGPDLYQLLSRFMPFIRMGNGGAMRVLINDFTGLVKDGEMMLVLGRPGSGCSTFLKTIANNRETFADVTGEVRYGGIDAAKQKKQYRGEVNYNPEDDVHFPELNVWQTFVFALLNKTKKRDKDEIPVIVDALLRMFGIPHTKYTKVGNEYVRGISGGERKRVSIAETLATKSAVICWDNSTRGLDASTALDYAKSLRIMTDVSQRTTVTTLYQAGQGIYDLMDKVLVIEAGKCVYQGPANEAKQYFVDLGFYCPDRQTTADFLTSCTDPNERQFREGYEDKCPKTPEELEKAFRESSNYKAIIGEVEEYEKQWAENDNIDAREFEQAVQEGKSHKTVSKKSPYTVSYFRQVLACAEREIWLLFGDLTTLYTKVFIIISNGLIVGSLFYGQPLNTEGAFSRGGTMFFSILFLGWLQLSELMKAVTGRAVVARQKDYALYRPSAVSLARVLVDFPVLLPQVIIFGVIMYFLTGLDLDVSKFFIYMLFVYTTTICITSLYRMFASLSPTIDDAVRFSGISLNLLIIYTGYIIAKPQLLSKYIWFGWLYYINPISYAFEGVLANEFSGRTMQCATEQLVPQGPNVSSAHQGCFLAGATVDAKTVSGSQYIETSYEYTRSHLWRNWAVVVAFAVLYILVTVLATELFSFVGGGGGALIFKKTSKSKKAVKSAPADEEKAGKPEAGSTSSQTTESGAQDEDEALQEISKSESIFTWQDVDYSVPYQGGQKQLLNKISGYAKPGVMVALMGASGAGKTTLLNTLAQRQSIGVVGGEMLVDGRSLGVEFQRGTGFCEQMDLHDESATIREALEFSAILRQDRSIPRSEKIEYVNKVLDLLELTDIQDAIVMSLGVEQRKRLTIGVELAAKPSLLLFLDEPTSGLDSQSAFSIIRFLKKLAKAGQAIVCTIHQPSSILIQQFDMILALNPGGNTFYFGPVGENGKDVIKYFADRGFECPPEKNVAEFILEMAAKPRKRSDGTRINWSQEWKDSESNKQLLQQIEEMKSERSKTPVPEVGTQHEYAAPIWTQTTMLTQRLFKNYWRSPSYLYGKLFVSVIVGIFNGFTFYMLGNTTQDMQNRMFSAFIILVIPPTIVNGVVPKFYQNMALWQARELPSRIYGWVAFVTAQVVGEIPISIVGSVIYFVLWYFPAGLPTDSSTAGYSFLMTMLFFLFMASWGQWICAFAPSFTVISNVLPFFFVMFSLFNGVVRPYSMLPVFWRYWMYYVNPSTYWIGGLIAATLNGVPVQCSDDETARFTPPSGQTCGQYAGAFVQAAKQGYLLDPQATDLCHYCPYKSGDEYMATLNVLPSDKWRNFGIFLAFCISNWALVYFFIYTVRIKGWSFGFGPLFGALGKMVEAVKGVFKKALPGHKEEEPEKKEDEEKPVEKQEENEEEKVEEKQAEKEEKKQEVKQEKPEEEVEEKQEA